MKRIHFVLCVIGCMAMALTSCNDDEGDPVEPSEKKSALLTRISRNGVTQFELFYDIDKKLYRINYYTAGVLTSYSLYEYHENGLKEIRRYTANHVLGFRSVFTLDNFGRISKGENFIGPDFDEVYNINQFYYNTSGQLVRKDIRLPASPVYSREEYAYDEKSNLLKLENTINPTQPSKYLYYQIENTVGDNVIPVAWRDFIFILGLSGLDDDIRLMFIDNSRTKSWDDTQKQTGDSSMEPSGRVYDDDGNLIRQVLTLKNLFNPAAADLVSEMTYDYNE